MIACIISQMLAIDSMSKITNAKTLASIDAAYIYEEEQGRIFVVVG